MSVQFHHLLFFLILTFFPSLPLAQEGNVSCPLNFTILRPILSNPNRLRHMNTSVECHYIRQGLRLVLSDYLRRTGSFFPPLNSSESCWQSYQSLVPNFDIRSSCGFQTAWISQGCMNLTTKAEFEVFIGNATLSDVVSNCNQSLQGSACASCTRSVATVQALYMTDNSTANVSDCTAYPSIYAAAVANYLGPTDEDTAPCLFSFGLSDNSTGKSKKKGVILGVVIGVGIGLAVLIGGSWFVYRKYQDAKRRKRRDKIRNLEMGSLGGSGLGSISESTNLVKFTFDEIKKATGNFSRDNIIGRGGYGNVYKGYLPDGSEVALKRFKNCSAAGDASFTHEVEVIASVRHVNLVALRGYCTATTPLEGHQRIIVCDLMKNGSLHDHLFGSMEGRLSWPIRQKIALGTARGLAYLHYGAQPAIIHRDIKASNILLDEMFEAKDERTLDVIEDGMPELGPPEVLEKYVLIAVLCSHPELLCRPSMDQVVKMLETDISVPSIPERPIPLVAHIDDIERSISSNGSGQLSSPTGYQMFTHESSHHSGNYLLHELKIASDVNSCSSYWSTLCWKVGDAAMACTLYVQSSENSDIESFHFRIVHLEIRADIVDLMLLRVLAE
ncbi:Protein kinase domain - like 10 [Theobroma cacao]|nr:Protein kinase domain - like 10 [Theobroma cacao]